MSSSSDQKNSAKKRNLTVTPPPFLICGFKTGGSFGRSLSAKGNSIFGDHECIFKIVLTKLKLKKRIYMVYPTPLIRSPLYKRSFANYFDIITYINQATILRLICLSSVIIRSSVPSFIHASAVQ